jgi:hypothetical protein
VGDCLADPALLGTERRAEPSSEALHDGTDPSWPARGDGYPSPRGPRRLCGGCDGPIPPAARSDAIYCSTRCRQASHRFGKGRALRVAAGRPLPGDELVDLFPGSGGIGRAWRLYTSAGASRRNTGEQPAGAACG